MCWIKSHSCFRGPGGSAVRSRIGAVPIVLSVFFVFAGITGSATAADQLGSMCASLSCGPWSDDCFASASFYNSSPSFTTDYYGDVDLEVDWTASADFFYWYEDEFDVDFKWYVDGNLKKTKSVSCSNDCTKTGKMTYTMSSSNGTMTYTVKLKLNVTGEDSCSDYEQKTVSITRPLCHTTLTLDGIGDKSQNSSSVTISGTVKDDDCGAVFSDNGSIHVVVKDPDNSSILSTWINLINGSFSTSCTLPPSDDPDSYGTYIVTATYDANSPTGHDRDDTGTSDTETFDRKYSVQVPSPPVAATAVPEQGVPGSNRVAISDWDDSQIYIIDILDDLITGVISMVGLLTGAPQGLADVPDFINGGEASLLVFSDELSTQLSFIDMEGNLVYDYEAPCAHPFGLTYDGEGLWVADSESGTLYQCDLASGQVMRELTPNIGPITGITWDPGEGRWAEPTLLAVSPGETYRIHRLDPNDGTVLEVIDLGPEPHHALTVYEGDLVVGNFDTQELYMLYEGAPGTPDDVQISSDPDDPRIHLTWRDPDAEPEWDRIRIYRDGGLLAALDPGVEEYWDSEVVEETYHEYHLTAYNESDDLEGAPSDTVGCYAGRRPPMTLNVPGDYESIQTAIFASQDGDEILVQPGTYPGPVDFRGRNVEVLSAAGPSMTIIDGEGYPLALVVCDSTESAQARFSGFTVTGGDLRHRNGVIEIGPDASPVIENNVITGNTVWYAGGGILCEGGGSGVATVEGNTIAFNLMRPDTLEQFQGGGIYLIDASPVVTHNLVAANDSSGYAIFCEGAASPDLACNDLWDSFLGDYYGCEPGETDFSEDPLFCDPAGGDLQLCADSPCLDGYGCGRIGALDQGCDACASTLDWADHDVGDCVLTMTDQGILGFMDGTQTQGSGFIYPPGGSNLLYLGSLWVGESDEYVANRDYDDDPEREWVVSDDPNGHIWIDGNGYADQAIHALYTDAGADVPRGLSVHQESWAFANPEPAHEIVLVHYLIRNDGPAPLSDLYAGAYLDLDLGDYAANTGGTDAARDLAYMTDASGIHAGVRLLRNDAGEPAVGNVTLVINPTYVWPDGYMLDADKYAFLSAADPDHVLSDAPDPDDYSLLVSAGPFALAAGEERIVTFAIVGGVDLEDLQDNADVALLIYRGGVTDAPPPLEVLGGPARLLPNTPNPFEQTTAIRFVLGRAGPIDLGIYDVNGRLVRSLARGDHPARSYVLTWNGRDEGGRRVAGGVYFLRLATEGRRESRRILLVK